jgi:hypothetical protein
MEAETTARPFVGVFVPKPLHDGKVRLVPSERLQALRQSVVSTGLFDVRKPSLRRDPPAKAEEDQTLRRCDRTAAEAKRRKPSDSSAGNAMSAVLDWRK